MGNNQGRHHHGHKSDQPKQATPTPAAGQQQDRGHAGKKKEEPMEVAPSQTYDVVITATSADATLVAFIKAQLESASIQVYWNSGETEDAAKLVGKVLVDAKLLVFVVSEEASQNSRCQDQVSLAYISNKPIVVAAKQNKTDLIKNFQVGMKLTLQSLSWTVFDKEAEKEAVGRQFVQLVQEQLTKPVGEQVELAPTQSLQSAPPGVRVGRGVRLNTKLRAQSTTRDGEDEGGVTDTFWERNFQTEEEVPWFRFQQAFLSDYEAQLSGLFDDDNIPWLLEMLKKDVFGGAEKISKSHFMTIRGDSPEKNAFWRVVSQVAIEKFNMKEVFNMYSSVRLTAIEKLAQFQNPGVIEALITLLSDPDPNVRAVAAISLGRTGTKEEYIFDELIKLLEDKDRIVRQSACLSLGHLQSTKAIPHISHIWRNDFISVVRNAARTALEKMDVPEAKEVLRVTKVLEDEIEILEGGHVAV